MSGVFMRILLLDFRYLTSSAFQKMADVEDTHRERDSTEEDLKVDGSARVENPLHCDENEANIDQVMLTELYENEDEYFCTEVKQLSDIRKIYDERKRIEDLVYEKDQAVGKFHTREFRGDLKLFPTEKVGSIYQGFQTNCESPTVLKVELEFEKIKNTKHTFRLSVRLHRKDMKESPTKVNLTTSMESENGVELAYISFESLVCNDKNLSTIAMSTEKEMDCIPDKAKYKILVKVSGCCGQKYFCPEVWPTSKTPRTECKYKTLQKDLDMARRLKYFADVELECGIETYKANKLILNSRAELFKLILETTKDQTNELVTNSAKLIRKCYGHPEAVNEYLKYLYSGDCNDLTAKNAIQLFLLANSFELEGLKLIVRTALLSNIAISNFVDVYWFNRLFEDKALTEVLLKYAEKHEEEIIEFYDKRGEKSKKIIEKLFKSIHHEGPLNQTDESSKDKAGQLPRLVSSKEMADRMNSLDVQNRKKVENMLSLVRSRYGINVMF
ncbi:hypothetical protein TNCT_384841 [Trichonephila clavata]|uniref:BTB domain-containing protein n=1 Tax=Trichonephila clavata TaxID=2740835 RepID=A0A8X6KLC1_TRICU|nr:hypothetical protein TNCT_384841 [Trichonephila clavata]